MDSDSQCLKSTSSFVEVGQRHARRAQQLKSLSQGEDLKVVEHLEGKTV
jgi:hypothetical protein